jgi:hypothetical protein
VSLQPCMHVGLCVRVFMFMSCACRYYIDLLFLCLKEEKSYDRVPNFTVRSRAGVASRC